MADQKITALTENTTPVLTDIFPMVDDPSGTASTQKITVATLADLFASNSLFRQALINGNFDIWQRGISFASTASTSQYSADRWQIYSANTSTTFSQQANPFDTAPYSMRVQRNNASAGTNALYLANTLETKDSIKFRGQKVTLSFWAKAGANYSPTSGYLGLVIRSGTGTDEDVITGFTGAQTDASSNVVLTTSWQKFTLTTSSVLRSTITGLGVQFEMTPTGTAGASDYYEVAQVQLCAGPVALPFMPKSNGDELRACQRYFEIISGLTQWAKSASAYSRCVYQWKVVKRAAPTCTIKDSAGTTAKYSSVTAGDTVTAGKTPVAFSPGTVDHFIFTCDNADTGVGAQVTEITAESEL